MGKVTGFKEWKRRLPVKQPVDERLKTYREIYLPQDASVTANQAARCMDCGVPFCQQGCPLGNHIPDWNDLVYRGRWREAYEWLAATNNFPEFTGRLCPAPCEASCTLAINQDPVTIEEIEKQIIERAYDQGWVQPRPPQRRTGKTVAVVGSGPAGLAAASQLNAAGHQVVVYEADDRLGGMLRYGIPDFKMEKTPIDRRLNIMKAEGIEFRTGVRIGDGLSWEDLRRDHDALLIAIGAQKHRDLDIPGRDLDGVCFAMDYLTRQNRIVAGDDQPSDLDAKNKHVIILGGGDTGSDCYGTALRQGARSVTQIQLWPAPPTSRKEDNPWPQWPLVFRTSSSQEEGGEREFACVTKRLLGDDRGRIRAVELVRIDTEEVPGARRPRAIELPETRFEKPCDLLILAIGFIGPKDDTGRLGASANARGIVEVGNDFMTDQPGVFAAGDAMRGASLIVWAIADGRQAAHNIDSYLRHQPSQLPTKGLDSAFE